MEKQLIFLLILIFCIYIVYDQLLGAKKLEQFIYKIIGYTPASSAVSSALNKNTSTQVIGGSGNTSQTLALWRLGHIK